MQSYSDELERMQTREATITERLIDLDKEKSECETELTLLAARIAHFKQRRNEVQASMMPPPTTVRIAEDNEQSIKTSAQLAQMQMALASLVSALATQAPSVVQSLPPAVLQGLAATMATAAPTTQASPPQLGIGMAPVQPAQAMAPQTPVVAPHGAPPAAAPLTGGPPVALGYAAVTAAQVAAVPTPLKPSAHGGAAGHRTSGGACLGVRRKAIKSAMKEQRQNGDGPPQGDATAMEYAEESDFEDTTLQEGLARMTQQQQQHLASCQQQQAQQQLLEAQQQAAIAQAALAATAAADAATAHQVQQQQQIQQQQLLEAQQQLQQATGTQVPSSQGF